MIQTEEPAVKKPVVTTRTKKKEVIPFDTSVRMAEGGSEVILNLMGTFQGSVENQNAIEFAFMSQVMKGHGTIRLKVSETFYANGHKALLARTISSQASKSSRKIIFEDYGYWSEVSHFFSKN